MVGGLKTFFLKKRNQLVTFEEGKKMKNRKSKDIQKWEKMRRLSNFLKITFEQNMAEELRFQTYFEICFKFGNLDSPNVNDLFEEEYPDYQNQIII
jgi:hypothetical protein